MLGDHWHVAHLGSQKVQHSENFLLCIFLLNKFAILELGRLGAALVKGVFKACHLLVLLVH